MTQGLTTLNLEDRGSISCDWRCPVIPWLTSRIDALILGQRLTLVHVNSKCGITLFPRFAKIKGCTDKNSIITRQILPRLQSMINILSASGENSWVYGSRYMQNIHYFRCDAHLKSRRSSLSLKTVLNTPKGPCIGGAKSTS